MEQGGQATQIYDCYFTWSDSMDQGGQATQIYDCYFTWSDSDVSDLPGLCSARRCFVLARNHAWKAPSDEGFSESCPQTYLRDYCWFSGTSISTYSVSLINHTATINMTEIRCLDVSSRYCCYGNHAAGSKPVKKTFTVAYLTEKWMASLVPKTISNCRELVKLCHIKRSGPVFSDTV